MGMKLLCLLIGHRIGVYRYLRGPKELWQWPGRPRLMVRYCPRCKKDLVSWLE
jgi:hypothetical protein